jgi:hypothetical protein
MEAARVNAAIAAGRPPAWSVGGIVKGDRLLAPRREQPVDAQAQRSDIAGQPELDRLPRQGARLAAEQHCGGARRLVQDAGRTPGRIARRPLLKAPPPVAPHRRRLIRTVGHGPSCRI